MPSKLPALAADVAGDLPALDREHLAAFDEQIAALVMAARSKGFSGSTVLSILAARERLYAERGAVWNRLVLYGEPLVSIDRFAGDESAARAWVIGRLEAAVSDHVTRTVRARPYFEAWWLDHGLDDDFFDDAVLRAYMEYGTWLDQRGREVLAEAAGFFARQPQRALRGSVVQAARRAVTAFHAVAFSEFDELFESHLRRGIAQVGAVDPLPPEAPPATESRGRLRRLVDRLFDDNVPTTLVDRKDHEYRALSDFFTIGRALSAKVDAIGGSPEVVSIVDELKRATGLDAVEAAVLGQARSRLDALVNRETAFAFLARFDPGASGRSARGARRPDDRSAADDEEARRRAHARSSPVTYTEDAGGRSVAFPGAALGDDTWADGLYDTVGRMLRAEMPDHEVSRAFVETLCSAAHEALTTRGGEGGGSLFGHVRARLSQAYHPDARVADGDRRAADDVNARTLSRLLDLRKAGRCEIRAVGATVIISTSPRPGP